MMTINNKIVKGQEGLPISTLYVKSKADVPHLYIEISPLASLKRTNKVYSNYSDAKDTEMSGLSEGVYNTRRWLKDNIAEWIPAGVSNCTLTATQWIDPGNPIRNAASIYNNPNTYGYRKVNTGSIGDLLIARNPNDDTFHTMLITGFTDKDGVYNFDGTNYKYKKGEPLLTYSRGGHDESFIRRDVPLSIYTINSDGKTENNYYTYNKYYKKKLLSGGVLKGQDGLKNGIEYNPRPLGPFDLRPVITIDPTVLKHYVYLLRMKVPRVLRPIYDKAAESVLGYNKYTLDVDHSYDDLGKDEEWIGHPLLAPVREFAKIMMSPLTPIGLLEPLLKTRVTK